MSVWCIQVVDMDIVMVVHGSAFVILIGEEFYVIKVSISDVYSY